MPFSITRNDILWTRNGSPTRVENQDLASGKIFLDENFEKIQKEAPNGIRNGLEPVQKEIYKSALKDIENEDKKQEIRDLYETISQLKKSNANSRVIKYLENELQYRIVRENFLPEKFAVKPVILGV